MATVKNGFKRGRVSDVTYSERDGVQIVKGFSKKPKYDKSIASIESSTVFGKASNLASYFRDSMTPIHNELNDGGMSVRLTGVVVTCLRPELDDTNLNFNFKDSSFRRLIGFEFNIKSPFQNYFFAQPVIDYTVENQVEIKIPEMKIPKDLVFPAGVHNCKLVLTCGLFDLENGALDEPNSVMFDIENTFKATKIPAMVATFETRPGCLCMIGISLQFYKRTFAGEFIINNKEFNPGAILSTQIIVGVADPSNKDTWYEMQFKSGRKLSPTLPAVAPKELN